MSKFISWFKSLFNKPTKVEPLPKVNTPVEVPKVEPKPEKPKNNVIPINHGNAKNPDWDYLWKTCTLDLSRVNEIAGVCQKILNNKSRYELVETYTMVPWYLIAALHYREASLNFNTVLHNGEKLSDVNRRGTILVPKGRGKGKNWTWEEAAIDALKLDGLHKIQFDNVVSCLVLAEKFNGMGYRKTGELSPYVWAGTNQHDETGKYVADGKFSSTAVERQLGVAAIIKGLGVA